MDNCKNIKVVIFDMGGVFLRTENRQPRLRLAEKYGLTSQELEALVFGSETHHQAEKGLIPAEAHWAAVGKTLGINENQVREFRRQFFEGDELDRELLGWISSLRPRFRTAMLSNAWSDLRSVLTRMGGVFECFDHVFISAEIGMVKPQPEIYQHVLHQVGVQAKEVVFTDDFQRNIAGAKAVGLHAIWFETPEQVKMDLSRLLEI